jgi:ribA/ribD-fused uncharacterized protein
VTPIDSLAALLDAIREGYRPRYLFFWGHIASSPKPGRWVLSQWWPAAFTLDGVRYPTAEHFMMAEKARRFGDHDAAARILAARTPGEAKKLGRLVKGFDDAEWERVRFDVVLRASRAKFGQDPALRRYLLETGDRVLVEASPVDRIWGIGLAADDPAAADPECWRGLNLLGFALMETRRQLAAEAADHHD